MPYRLTREDGRSFQLDGVGRIAVSPSNRITDHPIESGSSVADHVQPLPLDITVTAFATETPLSSQSSTGGQAHVDELLAFLEEGRQGLWIFTGDRIGTVSDLALTRWPHDFGSTRGLILQLGFKQVRVATAQTVVISVEATSEPAEFADEVDTGEQATEELPDDAETEQDKSDLYTLLEGLGAI